MKAIGFLFLCSIFIFCESKSVLDEQNETKIRVVNNSVHELESVSLFSVRFNNLAPGDTTAYQVLDFDESKDDPMLYCMVDINNLSLFLEIPKNGRNYTYSIDSLDLVSKRIYFERFIDN
ncbi:MULTISPECIES: hypothetical protein [Arenibacter]|uniref:hypothetical protein n=1 Tax=Arenibacter TaxID=178469 RepID=UPI001300022B|nr:MULTISPECIES: hypothetical protein [Arenibacter]